MTKRILTILLVLSSLISSSQVLQYVNTFGYDYNRFNVRTLLGIPSDTFAVPVSLQAMSFVARKGTTIYGWNVTTHIWESMGGSGGASGIDDVLAIGQDLTANREMQLRQYTLSIEAGRGLAPRRVLALDSLITQIGSDDSPFIQTENIPGGDHVIGNLNPSLDTVLYKPIARRAATGVIKQFASWAEVTGGGGSGSPNTSIGAGYKVAVDATNNVKSLSAKYGITLDSATAGEVGIAVDTSKVMLNNRALGPWFTFTNPNSLPTGWTTFGYSPTFSSGAVLPSNSGSITTGFLYTNTNFTASQNYIQEWVFKVNTKPLLYTDGVYAGSRSDNTSITTQNAIVIRPSAGSTMWRAHINILYSATINERDSTAAIPLQIDSFYKVRATFSRTHIYVEFMRVNSVTYQMDSVAVSCQYKYSVLATDLIQPRNTGGVWMAGIGTTGNYTMKTFTQTHLDKIGADVVGRGNSVLTRYDASSLPLHWWDMAFSGVKYNNTVLAGGGDRFQEFLLDTNEVKALLPKVVVFEGGLNGSAADYRTYGKPYIEFLQRNNITPVWLKLFSSVGQDSIFWNVVRETGSQWIDGRNSIISPAATGAHLTDAGSQTLAYTIQGKISEILGYTGGKEPSSPTLPIIIGSTDITSGTAQRFLLQDATNKVSQTANFIYDVTAGGVVVGTGIGRDRLTVNNGGIYLTGITVPGGSSGAGLSMGHFSGGYAIIRDMTNSSTYNDIRIGSDILIVKGATPSVGIGLTGTLQAWLDIKAGTTAMGGIHQTAGTLTSTIVSGDIEYNGNHYTSSAALNRYSPGGMISQFTTAVSNGTTVETDLYTYTTKANTLNATGEMIEMELPVTLTDATADKVVKVYFAGTEIYTTGTLAGTLSTGEFKITVMRTGASTASAKVSLTQVAGLITIQTDLTGLTFSGTNIIKVTGQASGVTGGSGDITAHPPGFIKYYAAANN